MTHHWCGMYSNNESHATIREIAQKSPGLYGVYKRVKMRDLFDEHGDIDIKSVVEDAIVAREVGLKLSIMVEDKTFDGTNPLPEHIAHLTKKNTNGTGYVAIRWNNDVLQETIRALCGVQLVETVHSVCLQETAPSMKDHDLDITGYTPELYGDIYVDVLKELHRVAPGKPVHWFTNYFARDHLGKNIDRALEAVYQQGNVRLGGPDWWPESAALNERSYPRFLPWHERGVPTFIGMSKPSYEQQHEGGFYTPSELLDGAQDTLAVDEVFWMYVKAPPAEGAYCYFDATHMFND